jgi:hypothetical protein
MTRPRRLYSDGEKFYYIINKKRVFVKVPKGASMKQVQKVNVKTIINLPERKRIKRRKKRIDPKFQRVPQKNLTDLLVRQNEGGLPYYIFKEKQQFPTLDEISKGVKKEPTQMKPEMKPEPPIKQEPIFTPMKPEPPVKQVPKPSKFFNKKIEVIDLSKPTPPSIFSFNNPFKRTAKISPEVETTLPIKPTTITNFDPYIQFMKSTNRKNYTSGLLKVFKENDLPAPSKGDADYKSFKTDLKKALKDYNKTGDDDDVVRDLSGLNIEGKGIMDDTDGLYNDEIEKVLTKRISDFVPVIPADKTDDLLKYVAKGDKRFGAIINTADSRSDGTGMKGNTLGHWTAIYINNEDSYPSIEFFDALVQGDIPERLYQSLKKIAKKMNPEIMFKFKPNMIRRQDYKRSTCGYHSMKFLDDRYNSIPFSDASGYDDYAEQNKGADGSADGEADIEKDIKKFKSYI